jgi:predicted dehydrogenase
MMEADVVRCGIIGAGMMGVHHAEFLAKSPNAKLVAVADLRREVAEELVAASGGVAYGDYEEMLNEAQLDLVIIATPDSVHREPSVAACQAGVSNLVIQKPLATKLDDAVAITDAAAAAGARVFLWYGNRGYVADMATKYAITSGMIGRVIYGDIVIDDNISVPLGLWGERSQQWVAESSPAQFLTTHTVDRLMWYFGSARIQQVFAIEQREILKHTPDLIDAFLTFDTGLKVRVKAGWVHHIERGVESGEMYNGTAGQIMNLRSPRFGVTQGWRVNLGGQPPFEDLTHHQQVLKERGLSTRIIWREPRASGWRRGITAGLEVIAGEAPNREILEFILDAITEDTIEPKSWKAWQGDGPLPMADVALDNVRVIDAIHQSARTGLPVGVSHV